MEQNFQNQIKLESASNQLNKFVTAERKHKKYTGLETGFAEVDEMIDGLQKLVVLGGIAGAGKTTLSLQLALGVAKTEKVPVLFISYEMTEADLLVMAMQNLSEKTLRQKDLLKPQDEMTSAELANYNLAQKKLSEVADYFYFVDHSKITPNIAEIRKNILAVKEMHQSEDLLVVIDSFDDLIASNKSGLRSDTQEDLISQLELLQHETNATILVVAQKDRDKLNGSQQDGLRGDVSLYHKPTIVMELINYKEILQALDNEGRAGMKREKQKIEKMVIENGLPLPSVLFISKHRYGVNQSLQLRFHGSYRSFDAGRIAEFNNPNKFRIYSYFEI